MATVIETERLALSHIAPEDAGFILELLNEPSFIANIGDRNLRTLAEAQAYVESAFTATYERLGFGFWLVRLKATGEPIGICGLLRRDFLDAPDVGYALLDRHAGQGYASEAAAGALAEARRLGVERVYAFTNPGNTASRRVLERAGLVYQHDFTRPGETTPLALYATAPAR